MNDLKIRNLREVIYLNHTYFEIGFMQPTPFVESESFMVTMPTLAEIIYQEED